VNDRASHVSPAAKSKPIRINGRRRALGDAVEIAHRTHLAAVQKLVVERLNPVATAV
jgi:hypothetical protein